MHREARSRILRLAQDIDLTESSVEHQDQQTGLCDARTALNLARGAEPNEINPASGRWSPS